MAELRVLSWNSTGEAWPRGTVLAQAVNHLQVGNGAPPLQLLAIQEARTTNVGTIHAALANAPFTDFVHPEEMIRERPQAPQGRAYRVSWREQDPNLGYNLAQPFNTQIQWVPLDPVIDNGVNNYINAQIPHFAQRATVKMIAASIRWPIYQHFTCAGCDVHFFTWHAPLLGPWISAHFTGAHLQGPALPEAFLFFQHSDFYQNIRNQLRSNSVIVIVGDLNMTRTDIQWAAFFPNFAGFSNNLSHIIAYSPGGFMVDQGVSYPTQPLSPHDIISARISW